MSEGVELKDTLNSYWKDNKSNFGFRMLQKMGWKEDEGLGKEGTGMTQAVKIKKRSEGLGLGMDQMIDDSAGGKSWSKSVNSLNEVLSLLQAEYGEKSKKNKKEKKEKKEKKAEKSSKRPIVKTRILYKKIRAGKDISSKNIEDKKAIFGLNSSVFTNLNNNSGSEDEKEKKKKKDKKEKKEKKEKK